MANISFASNALFVIDGTSPSPAGAAVAKEVLGPDVHWTVVSVIAEHPRFTVGATGFASSVLSAEEMDSQGAADLIAGDAAAAATAQGFGSQPVTQSVVRGDFGDAVARYVNDHHTDLVVVVAPELATPLVESGIPAVLVVAVDNAVPPDDHQ
ncbi:MAG: hypothetical protein WA964_04260 [Ilumatobacter sp.]|uniref:hypothetical protein n=1 Tax=Ilumatobacter sp. TaxID=1967498 RepID=UPI003C730045